MADKAFCINWDGDLRIVPLHAVGPVLCHIGEPWDAEKQELYSFMEGEQWAPEQCARMRPSE